MNIGLSSPDISDAEIAAVADVLRSGRLSLGPKVEEFEAAVAGYCGAKHGIAVSSGTCGLHLLARAMEIGPGDEVITTPFSFVASTNCFLFEGGIPRFVDIDARTWNINVDAMAAAISPRTKVLLPVDVFGVVPPMEKVRALATKHRLRVIEDSCEALGATYRGKKAGTLGDAGVFGFYPNKQITTGEGGLIVTDDDRIAAVCRSMRNQGRDTMAWLCHDRMGYNYRLADVNCAIGVEQMKRIDAILARRNQVAAWYMQRLRDEPRLSMQQIPAECGISWFVFVVKLADRYDEAARNGIIEKLRAAGIGCSNYFAPIHLQKYMMERFGCKRGDYPVCEAVAARTIALPFHAKLSESQVDEVCAMLRKML